MIEQDIHFICSFFILAAAVVPVYLSVKIKTKNLRVLTVMLSVFITVHGVYHIAGALGLDFVSEDVFEPLSYAILIAFGLYYLSLIRKKEAIIKYE